MKFNHDVVEAIGNTPLIKLVRASEATGCTILGKAEFMNPGQSVKDRAGKWMILEAEKRGDLKPGCLDHQATGFEVAALLGFEDHPFARAVLHRLAGIHEFGLAEDGAAGRFGSPHQLDERGVADRFNDVVVEFHVGELPVIAWTATLMDRCWAHKPTGWRGDARGHQRDFANTTWRTSIFPDRNPASQ